MIRYLLRTLWRLIILGLGVGLAYLAVFVLFPYLDRRLPLFVALLGVYIAIAYFGLPALLRTWRVFIRHNHIPLYVTTRDGIPSDPVNIAVIAKSRHQFIKSMQKAGWYKADKATLRSSLREGWAILFDKPYPTAPFSALFLFNRSFDLGFEKPYGESLSPRHRHHVRFWQLVDRRQDLGHFRFWIRHFRQFIGREKTVWIGAAVDDVNAYGIRWYNLQITHRTHAKHYRERDLIISDLHSTGHVKDVSEVQAGAPFAIRSQQFGVSFISDGTLKIVELR